MPGRVVASAPAKLILMGEHAVVYGRPAISAALDLRCRVEVTPGPEEGLTLRLEDVGVCRRCRWGELMRHADRTRELWEAFAGHPDPASLARMRGSEPGHLAMVAVGRALSLSGRSEAPRAVLSVRSDIPIGSGFGSSAALAVAVAAALFAWLGVERDGAPVADVALEAERCQHGTPSGVDHRTVLGGGVLWARRTADGQLEATGLGASAALLGRLQIVDSGQPSESTGEVVASVHASGEADPEGRRALLDRMEAQVSAFRPALVRGEAAAAGRALRAYQRCLEELEVVPRPVLELVRAVESGGGSAKISGAGSLRGPGAGAVLILPPTAAAWQPPERLAACGRIEAALGCPGLRLETSA